MANVGDTSTCRTCGKPIVVRPVIMGDKGEVHWIHAEGSGYEKGKHLVHTAKGADGRNTA